EYANATYETLFTEEERKGAIPAQAEQLKSCVIWNDNEGKVTITPLPWQAQLTTQFTAAVEDVNGDDRPDIWLGGNIFGMSPQVGRSDAGRGALFLNGGNRKWTFVNNKEAGIEIAGEVRDAQFIDLANGTKALLVGKNNASMEVFQLKTSK
ncbi:MAG: hypothetical protein AAFQ37_04915, partial [Bacteroidota bacterium]